MNRKISLARTKYHSSLNSQGVPSAKNTRLPVIENVAHTPNMISNESIVPISVNNPISVELKKGKRSTSPIG